MGSFVARAILFFIFGFILFDTIKESNKLFDLYLNPYLAIIPAVLIYGFSEFMFKKWTGGEKQGPIRKSIKSNIGNAYFLIVCAIIAGLFLCILIVWAGVIYKKIVQAI